MILVLQRWIEGGAGWFREYACDQGVPLSLQGKVAYKVDKIKAANDRKLTLESGAVLPADVIVNAREKPFLCSCCLHRAHAIAHKDIQILEIPEII